MMPPIGRRPAKSSGCNAIFLFAADDPSAYDGITAGLLSFLILTAEGSKDGT
jgi:hypothetical protein